MIKQKSFDLPNLLHFTLDKSSSAVDDPKPDEDAKKDSEPVLDLLNDDTSPPDSLTMKPLSTTLGASSLSPEQEFAGQSEKSSRQRGFEELDLLGESLLKKHLPDKRSPQFEKKKAEKLSLNVLQQQKQKDFTVVLPEESDSKLDKDYVEKPESPKKKSELKPDGELQTQQNPPTPATTENSKQQINVNGANKNGHSTAVDEVKLADLNVPISSSAVRYE